MGLSMSRAATRWVRNDLTVDDVAAITSVGFLYADAATVPQAVSDFLPARLVKDDTDPLWKGKPQILVRVGARSGSDVQLAPGDHQSWRLVSTADEDMITATGTLSIT